MTYKKNRLSYILWAVYTCITGVMLADYTMLIWKKQINLTSHMYMIGFVFLFFAMAAGLYFLLKKIGEKTLVKHKINEHTRLMWEIFAVLAIFVTAVLYRFYLVMQTGVNAITDMYFYDLAVVREGAGIEPLAHGASYIYVQFLSFVLSFLGNKIIAAVWMQMFLELLTILLAYFVIKKMLGVIPAFTVMVFLTFSEVYNQRIFAVTPEIFFFLLYLIGLYIAGSYVKGCCSNRLSKPMMILGALFSGIIIGVLAYLDAISLTLFIIMAGLITGVDAKPGRKKVMSCLLFLLTVIGAFLALFGAFIIDSYASGAAVETVAGAWFDLYKIHLQKNRIIYSNNYYLAECLIQVVLAALIALSFINRRKVQNSTPWMCLMFLLAPMPLTSVGVLDYQAYYVFIWSVLAGIGLQQSLFAGESEEQQSLAVGDIEERQSLTVGDSKRQQNLVIEDSEAQIEQRPGNVPSPKPRFIENPLPLPKKHEKRDMGYQYEVTEDKMEFDIEISDDDDFDV